MTRRRFSALLPLTLAALATSALSAQPAPSRPYVVLVSLDGFRSDYAERYHAANLLALGKAGATTEGMIPSFPSVTFPNHISIVTGQYPGHHGIVGNSFYDRSRNENYSMRRASEEGAWYTYKPLWVVAEQQHVKAASMFWPTSDAPIGGIKPTYTSVYDGSVPDEKRVATVLDWLKLPEAQRPHFITLYFSDTDNAGHSFGPDSPEVEKAVQRVDKLIGSLWTGVQALSLPVNLVVVSDHGMQTSTGFVNLSEYTDLSKVRVVTEGPFALIYTPDAQTCEQIYTALKGKSPKFDVYRRSETPQRWHYSGNERIGDLVVVVKEATTLVTAVPSRPPSKGSHGFDPQEFPTMRAIFYAAGPNVQPGVQLKPFENVNVFPFLTKILQLENPAGVDGSESVLDSALRK